MNLFSLNLLSIRCNMQAKRHTAVVQNRRFKKIFIMNKARHTWDDGGEIQKPKKQKGAPGFGRILPLRLHLGCRAAFPSRAGSVVGGSGRVDGQRRHSFALWTHWTHVVLKSLGRSSSSSTKVVRVCTPSCFCFSFARCLNYATIRNGTNSALPVLCIIKMDEIFSNKREFMYKRLFTCSCLKLLILYF